MEGAEGRAERVLRKRTSLLGPPDVASLPEQRRQERREGEEGKGGEEALGLQLANRGSLFSALRRDGERQPRKVGMLCGAP